MNWPWLLLLPFCYTICIKWRLVGDYGTCAQIAKEANLTLDELARLNPTIVCIKLFKWQHLCLASNTSLQTEPCTLWHSVAKGEYCWRFCDRYDLDYIQLYQLNPLLNCRTLQEGYKICVQGIFTPGDDREIAWKHTMLIEN